METMTPFRIELIRPRNLASLDHIAQRVGMSMPDGLNARFHLVPLLAVIVSPDGLPAWEPTLFLANCALRSGSLTGDTVRTYADALVPWLTFLRERELRPAQADEEQLCVFRAKLVHGGGERTLARTTANHRVTVASLFHQWGQRSGSMPSPLGAWLLETGRENSTQDPRRYGRRVRRLGIVPSAVQRLPRLLSNEEVSRLFHVAPMPYRLMFRWSLATGIRRFELCNLQLDQLPTPDAAARSDDGIVSFDLLRKGGKLCTLYAPVGLVEETNWYLLVDRPQSQAREVFVNQAGAPISRNRLSRVFRGCANQIGSSATLHHLRHTFAVHVLKVLEGYERRGDAMNSLKTLQVLLGHSSIETTEIYLRAVEVRGEPVVEALQFLYGGELYDQPEQG